MFKKFLTSDVVLVDAFFFELVDNLDLSCDCRMVGSRLPQCFISLHSLETDQDILHGLIECMSHVELSGYVRRRHNDCKWFFIWIYLCMEVSVIHPFLIKTFFQPFRVISLCKFFAHNILLIIFIEKTAPHTACVKGSLPDSENYYNCILEPCQEGLMKFHRYSLPFLTSDSRICPILQISEILPYLSF